MGEWAYIQEIKFNEPRQRKESVLKSFGMTNRETDRVTNASFHTKRGWNLWIVKQLGAGLTCRDIYLSGTCDQLGDNVTAEDLAMRFFDELDNFDYHYKEEDTDYVQPESKTTWRSIMFPN